VITDRHLSLTSFVAAASLILTAIVVALTLDPEQIVVILPAIAIGIVVVTVLAVLWKRDGYPPYFDVGVFCIVVTAIYLAYPLLTFLLSGLAWTELSDNRLAIYNPSPSEFARVAWWGVLYLASLASAYLVVRSSPAATSSVKMRVPRRSTIVAIVVLFAVTLVYSQVVQISFGVDLNPTYGPQGPQVVSLPLFLEQVTYKVSSVGLVLEFALIVLLVRQADAPASRWALWIWAALQVGTVVWVLGARSQAVFFLVAWLLAQQRLRPQMRPISFLLVGVLILAAATLYGYFRGVSNQSDTLQAALSASGEFQNMYGTVYNLMYLRDTGGLPDIPWQMYFADVLRLIPQQLLPFEKVDPSDWYLDLIGQKGTGVGFMFGVISEAVVGLGAMEMLLRGLIVGTVFGAIHNWYAKRATKFWPTLFYLWLCVRSYYTYRASSFYLLGEFVLVFIPAYLLVRVLGQVMDQTASNRVHVPAATK